MHLYLIFLVAHWELTLLFCIAFIWVVMLEINTRKMMDASVDPQAAVALINKKQARILDLRRVEIFLQGHIIGAQHIDFNPGKDDPKILNLSPKTVCLFVCNIGQTSAKVVNTLRAQGYLETYTLTGGMAAWQKENFPIVQGK